MQARKRRAVVVDDEEVTARRRPAGTQKQKGNGTQNRRNRRQEEEEEEEEEEESAGEGGNYDRDEQNTNFESAVKHLVRLCLASEHNRHPIRRQSEQVQSLMKVAPRQWNQVFQETQKRLREIFGLELVELPTKEKVTLSQKRAAARAEKPSSSTGSYVLCSVLPQKYRISEILGGQLQNEAAFMGFVTIVITLVYISGGQLSESRLETYLERMRADGDTRALGNTTKVLERMEKHNYLQKIKDSSSGETLTEYKVGPRAKVEIGVEGVINCVKQIWGEDVPADLEKRVRTSVGEDPKMLNDDGEGGTQTQTQTQRGSQGGRSQGAAKGRGRAAARPARGRAQSEEEEEEEEESD